MDIRHPPTKNLGRTRAAAPALIENRNTSNKDWLYGRVAKKAGGSAQVRPAAAEGGGGFPGVARDTLCGWPGAAGAINPPRTRRF